MPKAEPSYSTVFDTPVNLFVAGFIGAPQMNTFNTQLVCKDGQYSVTPFGSRIEVSGEKGRLLKEKGIGSREVVLGVRPEHMALAQPGDPGAIPCTVVVNEMMGSELHIHAETESGELLAARIPTIDMEKEEREKLVNGAPIHLTFTHKVIHLFDPESEQNLLYT